MLDQPTACTATKGTICQMVPDSELGKHSILNTFKVKSFSKFKNKSIINLSQFYRAQTECF